MSAPGPQDFESPLHDDKTDQSKEFGGATLMLNSPVSNATEQPQVDFRGPTYPQESMGLERDRPGSASMRSNTSSGSKTKLSPHIQQTDNSVKSFFSHRQGSFEAGVEKAQEAIVKPDLDGQVQGAWLLTEIDHWDNEREKLVILADNSLLIVNYDFIQLKVFNFKRVMLHSIDTLKIGDLVYPEKSLMPPRDHGGIQMHWGKGTMPSFAAKWNPWSSDIPYLTLSHHPMMYSDKERETVTFNVDDFSESLQQAVNKAYKSKNPAGSVHIDQAPILIETYASLSSLIFNQSFLGFNKERGGVSY